MEKIKNCKNSDLIPPYLINSSFFILTYLFIVSYGGKNSIWIPFFSAIFFYISQLLLFYKFDQKSFLVSIPLSIYALLLGVIQETLFINFNFLSYPNHLNFPPLWILFIYPLFALTLNSSFAFLNKNLFIAFLTGGLISIGFYTSLPLFYNGVMIKQSLLLSLFLFSGTFMMILILLNRKLLNLYKKYTDKKVIQKLLTVFFDKTCSFCSQQMENLKNRPQSGEVCYACPSDDDDLQKITTAFSYKEAMDTIHAIDENNQVLTGTETISALFARTNLPLIAIILQAPLFKPVFKLSYALFTKVRKKI